MEGCDSKITHLVSVAQSAEATDLKSVKCGFKSHRKHVRKERKLVKLKLKNSHGGYAGRSLIERIQTQLDKQNARLRAINAAVIPPNEIERAILQGRTEGMAATLAILRSSSLQHELEKSTERLK